jgi:hypothetical protein
MALPYQEGITAGWFCFPASSYNERSNVISAAFSLFANASTQQFPTALDAFCEANGSAVRRKMESMYGTEESNPAQAVPHSGTR